MTEFVHCKKCGTQLYLASAQKGAKHCWAHRPKAEARRTNLGSKLIRDEQRALAKKEQEDGQEKEA